MNYCYKPLNANEIKPKGWLLRQLRIQADGLAGQLDRMWPDVRDSKWFGGDREGWERAPYWLDGFMPLAYLLGDEDMIARVKKYMNLILENQQETAVLWSWRQDTRDWECPASECIVASVIKNLRDGDIILFHDFNCKNSPTPEALEKILSELSQKGYKFVTVSELMNM